jgi:hypothetical protein
MSKKFICPRCHYDTYTKCNIIKHLSIEKECHTDFSTISRSDALKDYKRAERKLERIKCDWCDKEVSKASLSRHRKTCSNKPLDIQGVQQQNSINIFSTLNTLTQSIQQLTEVIIANNIIPTKRNNIIQHITTNIQNVNANVTINNYGNEDTSHLTPEFLSHCLLNPTKGIYNLIDTIHYNPDVPSNHNILHKSVRNNTVQKYIGAQWIECDASNTLDELIRKGYRILNAHFLSHFANDPELHDDEIKARSLERFRFLGDKTCNDYHSVKRELRCLIKDKTMYVIASP